MKICNGWLAGARKCPSPNYNERPQAAPINLLVVHPEFRAPLLRLRRRG